jgi:hypothetical protein
VETANKPDLARILLQNWDSPLFQQLSAIGQEMEMLHKKIRRKPTDELMIQSLALSSQFEFCILYLIQGRTARLEFSPLYEEMTDA